MGMMTNLFLFTIVFSFLVVTLFPSVDNQSNYWSANASNKNVQEQLSNTLFGDQSSQTGALLALAGVAIGIVFPNPYTIFLGVAIFFSGLYLAAGNEIAGFAEAIGVGDSPIVLLVEVLLPIIFALALIQWHRYGSGDTP